MEPPKAKPWGEVRVLFCLRGEVWFMEIVFVGECEVFVCLDSEEAFFFSPWTRSS